MYILRFSNTTSEVFLFLKGLLLILKDKNQLIQIKECYSSSNILFPSTLTSEMQNPVALTNNL